MRWPRASTPVRSSSVRCSVAESNRPCSHELLTINNYVNCPSNFAFAHLFHLSIFDLCEYSPLSLYIAAI